MEGTVRFRRIVDNSSLVIDKRCNAYGDISNRYTFPMADVDGLIARLALEPAVPASSLLDSLASQLEQAAALHRLGLVRRTPSASARWSP